MEKTSTAIYIILATLISLALMLCVWITGPLPQFLFGHDMISILDGGWKWRNGVIPHADFYSFLGPLTYALISLGITVGGSAANAFPSAILLFVAILLPAALYCSFSRLVPPVALLATVFIVANTLAPHALKFDSFAWSYVSIYNRWGYSLFLLLMLLLGVKSLRPGKKEDVIGGILCGLIISTCFFLKITFAVIAIFLLLTSIVFLRQTKRFYLFSAVSFAIASLYFLFLIRWEILAFVHDMNLAFHARKGDGLGPSIALKYLYEYIFPITFCLLIFIFTSTVEVALDSPSNLATYIRRAAIFGVFILSSTALIMGNASEGTLLENPVICMTAIILFGEFILHVRKGFTCDRKTKHICIGVAVTASISMFVVVLPVLGRNWMGLLSAATYKTNGFSLPSDQTFSEGYLKGIQIEGFGGEPPLPTSYVGKIQDGIDLLRKTGNAEKPVVCLDAIPAFDVARGVRPSAGSPTGWTFRIFSPNSSPAVDQVFRQAEAVMIPKNFGDGNPETLNALMHHYGKYLEKNFKVAGESTQWILLTLKENSKPL